MKGRVQAVFCLLLLLATWSVASRIAAGQAERVERGTPSTQRAAPRHAFDSSYPIVDDGLDHLFAVFQTDNILRLPISLASPGDASAPGVERDLLSLTQQRRE